MFPKTSSPSCSVLSSFVGRDGVCREEGVCMRERGREGERKRDRERESHLSANTSLAEDIFSVYTEFSETSSPNMLLLFLNLLNLV